LIGRSFTDMSNAVKPHMKRRPGETIEQWNHRIAHSCYRCGTYIEHKDVLNQHEDHCDEKQCASNE
jgi:hypothetical protein